MFNPLKYTNIKRKHTKIKILVLISFVLVFISGLPSIVEGTSASLYLSPSSGTYTVGSTFSVAVKVNSGGTAINAAEGTLVFNPDELQVVSLSKSGSIFTLWTTEPNFSNSAGNIVFGGGTASSFTGNSGTIIAVVFKAKVNTLAGLSFSSGAVLAADGKGTNILSSLGSASFSLGIVEPTAPEAITPTEVVGTPAAPRISSSTHPDPNKWYTNSNPRFTWQVLSSITAVRLLYDDYPSSRPTVLYRPPISEKALKDVGNGIWYFHVQFQNLVGWGAVSHFRFQIDTEKPEYFEITEIERKDKTEPQVKFIFKASDKTSGIDHFEVQIDGGEWQIWRDDGSHIYETPILGPGKHLLIAKAIDKAGNFLANSSEFIIEALEPPILTEYPKELQDGNFLIIKGTTPYTDGKVNVWLEKDGEAAESQIVEIDEKGNWIFVAGEKLREGLYEMWAEAVDGQGAKSEPTDKMVLAVKQSLVTRIGAQIINYLVVTISLFALILLLIFILLFGRHKFIDFRKKIKKEAREADEASQVAFDILKKDIQKQVKLLERAKTKRELTEEEKQIAKQLKSDLEWAEKTVKKEIEDIEKEVK